MTEFAVVKNRRHEEEGCRDTITAKDGCNRIMKFAKTIIEAQKKASRCQFRGALEEPDQIVQADRRIIPTKEFDIGFELPNGTKAIDSRHMPHVVIAHHMIIGEQ